MEKTIFSSKERVSVSDCGRRITSEQVEAFGKHSPSKYSTLKGFPNPSGGTARTPVINMRTSPRFTPRESPLSI